MASRLSRLQGKISYTAGLQEAASVDVQCGEMHWLSSIAVLHSDALIDVLQVTCMYRVVLMFAARLVYCCAAFIILRQQVPPH